MIITHRYILFIILISCFKTVLSATTTIQTVRLTENNFVVIRGEIEPLNTAKIIDRLTHINEPTVYVYLDTPGGSVSDGMNIVNVLKSLEARGINVICVSHIALSMGFVITQYCPTRLVMDSSILMQHQMSIQLKGPVKNIASLMIGYIESVGRITEEHQAKRINVTTEKFNELVQHDWWIYGEDNIKKNTADGLAYVWCDFHPEIIKERVYTIFGDFDVYYSNCPLAKDPISFEFNDKIPLNIQNEMMEKIIQNGIPKDIFVR